jgi:predicted esterase
MRILFALLFLAACTTPTGSSSDDDDATAANDDDATEAPPELPGYSNDSCPTIEQGWNDGWASGDDTRNFRVELPDDPEGAPLIITWHWLGGTADQAIDFLGLDEWADNGAVIISPESRGLPVEWDSSGSPSDNGDLTLFDDLLTCAWEQFGIDADRVHTFGMSAGGLWTSYLIIHRSEWLASAAPLSGGADSNSYSTPDAQIPVLLTWGGVTDTYGPFSFDTSSRYLSDALRDDGHFVAECLHSGGHTVPNGAADYLWTWFDGHERGGETPFEDGLPSSFPSFCDLDMTP